MLNVRVIPSLLLKDNGFYKTRKFKNPVYLGDPINIVKIFNDKEADELLILDISGKKTVRGPNFSMLKDIASECFMPLAYGGGITSVDDVKRVLNLGFEKVVINSQAVINPQLVTTAANLAGSQSVVVSIDVKRNMMGKYEVCIHCGTKKMGIDPVRHAVNMTNQGAGEILINSIDRDGTMTGYDIGLIKSVSEAVEVPVIASGGAVSIEDFVQAVQVGKAQAVAAGAMFVFHGPHRAVLINMPDRHTLERKLGLLGAYRERCPIVLPELGALQMPSPENLGKE